MDRVDTVPNQEKSQKQWSDLELSEWMKTRHEAMIDRVDTDIGDSTWLSMLTVSFVSEYNRLSKGAREYLKQYLKGNNLVDIGCGTVPKSISRSLFREYSIASYTGIDLNAFPKDEPNYKVVKGEALEQLKSLPDKSACVMSNGFLCSEMFFWGGEEPEVKPYLRAIFREIKRVLPENGILVADHFDLDTQAKEAGLQMKKSFLYGRMKIYG